MSMAPLAVKDQDGNPKACNYKNKSVCDSFHIFILTSTKGEKKIDKTKQKCV